MKLLFVYDMPHEHEHYWRDGLWAALQKLETEWDITYTNYSGEIPSYFNHYDFVLGWGAPSSKVAQLLQNWAGKKGLCFGGGQLVDPMLDKFNVVFVENKIDLIKPHFRHAFGTNTDLFYPMGVPKIIDAIYPAAFAAWKHQEIFAGICEREGLKGLAVGYVQQNNLEESLGLMQACMDAGVAVMDWVPSESLAYLYNMSKEVILTADSMGGCQRSVLEGKACGVPVRIASTNPKLLELGKLTEEEVRKEWDHHSYARKLKEGILEVMK